MSYREDYRQDPIGVMPRRQLLKLGGATGLLAITGVGCTTTSDSGEKKLLNAAYHRPITTLDPHGPDGTDQGCLVAAVQIYDRMLERDGREIAPGLAEKWSNPDPKTWVFNMHRDVKFHDGTSLTARDAKISLERVLAENSPMKPLWAALDTVEATDDYTLQIKTTEPLGTVLSNLTLLYVLPGDKVGDEDFFRKPVGSGPFRVSSFEPSQHLDLVANGDYWRPKPKIEEAKIRYIPEVSARMTAIDTGEIDVTWTVPSDQISQLSEGSGIELTKGRSLVYWINWFNSSREPFDDVRVRRAMWHAVDLKKIISDLFGNSTKLGRAPIPSTTFGYAPQEPYAYDPDLAKRLLEEAGHSNGFSTTMKWPRGQAPLIKQFAQTLISYWAKAGIKVQGRELEEPEYVEQLVDLDWDVILQTTDVLTGDADFGLARLYTSDANRTGYKNKKLDALLIAARRTTDQAERAELYSRATEIIWKDAVGIFPGELELTYATRDNVRGVEPDPLELVELRTVSLA